MKNIFIFITCLLAVNTVRAQSCSPATAFDYLDINNVKARINNGGDMWWDLFGDAEYVVPKSGNVSSFFSGALWIGGLDANGLLHVAAQTYRQNGSDFFPGPIDANGTTTATTCSNFDRIWKVNKSTVDSFVAGLFASIPSSILEWPGRNNPNLAFPTDQDLAPFIDVDGNGGYDPAAGDYPGISGDQALWFVFNDVGNVHGETGGAPLGIEVRCMAYAFKDSTEPCINDATCYHYTITNKSDNSYHGVYTGFWFDPDLGCYTDDYAGCDSLHNLGIVYNSTAVDANYCLVDYGPDPPIAAVQILKGPVDANGITHYMDHFLIYQNDYTNVGNPYEPEHYYNYLHSLYQDGSPAPKYAYPSPPNDSTGSSMCSENLAPIDFREIVSSGPLDFNAGATQTLDIAAIWNNTTVYPCPSYDEIIATAECVKSKFDTVIFTGTNEWPAAPALTEVFPNPVPLSGLVRFSFANALQLDVYDLAGSKVFSAEVRNRNQLQVAAKALGKGVFIYRVLQDDHAQHNGKLIIE